MVYRRATAHQGISTVATAVLIIVVLAISVASAVAYSIHMNGAQSVSSTTNSTNSGEVAPYVWNTLFLANNTLYPGNVIPENGMPIGPTIDPVNGLAYVGDAQTVVVLNDSASTALRTLKVGVSPLALAFDPVNGILYLAGSGSYIEAADPATGAELANITVAAHSNSNKLLSLWTVSLAFDPKNGEIFASIQGINGLVTSQGWVSVINGSTNQVVANITSIGTPGFAGPGGLTYDPANGCIYSVDEVAGGGPAGSYGPGHGLVTVINGSTDMVLANVEVPIGTSALAFDLTNGNLYAVGDSEVMTVINGATNTAVSNMTIGAGPHGVAFDPQNGDLFVSGSESIQAFDPSTGAVLANTSGGGGATSVVYDPSNGLLYAASPTALYIVDGNTYQFTTIGLSSSPEYAALDQSSQLLYVEASGVYSIDEASTKVVGVGKSVPYEVSLQFSGAAFDTENGFYYTANNTASIVRVVNGTSGEVVATISVQATPSALVYDPANDGIYVFFDALQYQVINGATNKVDGTFSSNYTVGNEWWAAAYDPLSGEIFASGPGGVVVIDGTHTSLMNVGGPYPFSMVFDPIDGLIYAVDNADNAVTLISGSSNAVVGSVQVGTYPISLALDPSTGDVYVTNLLSGTISVIAP